MIYEHLNTVNRFCKFVVRVHCTDKILQTVNVNLFSGNAVIPKTSSQSRMTENLSVFEFSLDKFDMDCLNNLYKKAGPNGYRIYLCSEFKHSPFYPFPSEV